MGLSTHVLDTAHGCPGAGMAARLLRLEGGHYQLLKSMVLNADGRSPDGALFDSASLQKGQYRLSFDVAAYFRAKGVALPEPAFLDVVHVDFGIAHPEQNYHVPLLVTPWGYSTYRGS
jgi:5-hydroxyisourate hydrolase